MSVYKTERGCLPSVALAEDGVPLGAGSAAAASQAKEPYPITKPPARNMLRLVSDTAALRNRFVGRIFQFRRHRNVTGI
jgi:hypothetical protein